jgi:GNAT superfamily N-acetyltransferase
MDAPDLSRITIRRTKLADVPELIRLIFALADYEKLPRPDDAAIERLVRDGFGAKPLFESYIAFLDGHAVGYAIVFHTYSSFLAQPTLYLEDIFVHPDYRSQKIGLALFLAMAQLARTRNCGRMDWTVLHWNTLAIDFYKKLGAVHMHEWQLFRLTTKELDALPNLTLDF